MKTGEKIMERRQKLGYTLEQLGKLVGVSGLTVDRWEAGLETPDEEQLKRLSEIFGCAPERLLSDKEQALEPEWALSGPADVTSEGCRSFI